MKRFTGFFLVFLLLSSFSFTQWVEQTSTVTSSLYAVKVISPQVVWACGLAGTVIRTTDGGTTWVKVTVPLASHDCYAMDAVDANTAWVNCTNGSTGLDMRIFKTTNGGTTWTEQLAAPLVYGDAVKFADANFGIAVGDPATGSNYMSVWYTTNGGTNWVKPDSTQMPQSPAGEFGVTGCLQIIGNTVWFGTASDDAAYVPRIMKSTNKGLSWTASAPITGILGYLFNIAFKDLNNGVGITLGGKACVTTNGGTTWTVNDVNTAIGLRGVDVIPGTNAYVTVGGPTSTGYVYFSKTGGLTWEQNALPTGAPRLRGVDFISQTIGWAVGNSGKVYKYNGDPVPVELTSFNAKVIDSKVHINWTTATEVNNRGFEVQRMTDGNWIAIGFKDGRGTTAEATEYSFIDNSGIISGVVSYRLKQFDFDGKFSYSDAVEVEMAPAEFMLCQNYPNPFNPSTQIDFSVPHTAYVSLKVYDILGNEVMTLIEGVKEAGNYSVSADFTALSNGTYFYKLNADGNSVVKKMIFLK